MPLLLLLLLFLLLLPISVQLFQKMIHLWHWWTISDNALYCTIMGPLYDCVDDSPLGCHIKLI